MASHKFLWKSTIALICFELGLALVYVLMILHRGEAVSLLDFNGLRSLPSLLQAAHLFAIGTVCLLQLIFRQRMARRCSIFLLLGLSSLCFYGCLDELTKIHLILKQVNWQVFYLAWIAAIPILGWRDLIWAWREHRHLMMWVGTGAGVFLLGGFGAEILKGAIASELSSHASTRVAFLSEHLRITIEEFSELLGETLILYAFAEFTLRMLEPTSKAQSVEP